MNKLMSWNPWAAAPRYATPIFRELESIEKRLESLVARSLQVPVSIGAQESLTGGAGGAQRSQRSQRSQRYWDEFASPALIPSAFPEERAGGWAAFPPMDIHETDKEFVLKADLPDLQKSEVKVAARNGVLEISGEKKSQSEQTGPHFFQMERAYGAFERRFTLPAGADVTQAKARLHEGVLTIAIPKNAAAGAPSVEIELR